MEGERLGRVLIKGVSSVARTLGAFIQTRDGASPHKKSGPRRFGLGPPQHSEERLVTLCRFGHGCLGLSLGAVFAYYVLLPHEKRPGDREVVDSAFLVGVADEPEVGRGQGRGHSLYEYTA
jgi:hypothetical protein